MGVRAAQYVYSSPSALGKDDAARAARARARVPCATAHGRRGRLDAAVA